MFVFSKSVNAGRSLYDFAAILALADSIEVRGYNGSPLEAAQFVGKEVPQDLEPITSVLLRIVTAHYESLKPKANGKPILLPVPGQSEKEGKLSRREADASHVLARLTAMSDRDEAAMTGDEEGHILTGGNTRALALAYREACGLVAVDAPVSVKEYLTIAEARQDSLLGNRRGRAADTRAVVGYLLSQVPRLGRAQVMADLGCTGGKAQEYVAACEAFSKWPALFAEYGGYTYNYKVHNFVKSCSTVEAAREAYEKDAPEKLNRNREVGEIFLGAIPASPLRTYLEKVYAKDTTAATDLTADRQAAIAWVLAACA